ncbi:MAG: assimilatory sulfite reductase (NADPH) flavoprotein subunit [Neisseria sp.]|nr:assimilatory sulfite reductase (NADPH) flavoprotein subunit [Neisseria sp.]
MIPITPELAAQLAALDSRQLAFLAGYAWAQSGGQAAASLPSDTAAPPAAAAAATPPAPARRITILSASQTGNARKVAGQLADKLKNAGADAALYALSDYKTKQLAGEDIVLLVTSTQGEGEPPEEALPLYKLLGGKKAPDLSGISFAVLGLGDSSYPKFCQAGRDFDGLLAKLGGKRLAELGVCDLEYQAEADKWTDAVAAQIGSLAAAPAAAQASPGQTPAPEAEGRLYSREEPFEAVLSARQKITARHADKDVEHIEIDLSGSGIRYQAGDALGVWPVNDSALVDEILQCAGLEGGEAVQAEGGRQTDIRAALSRELDITQNTPQFVREYARLAGAGELQALADKAEELGAYLAATPPVGVMVQFPAKISAQDLYGLFRPQSPRLYSIASAQDEVGDEVHLTVGVVAFEHHGRHYTGAASGYLGGGLEEGAPVRVFVEPNKLFRLPEDGNTPIIMIGAGTGVAPFRAFMQQRAANGDSGKNWLVFGNRRFTDDFLYQTEWLQYRKDGLLTRADLAWSRQGESKVYVQDKLKQAAAEVWGWLQEGAHVYVCGDAARMAADVEDALLEIIGHWGRMDRDDAEEYLSNLREERRYQRDVY